MENRTKEILEKQLELLSERSNECPGEYLSQITTAMCEICDRLCHCQTDEATTKAYIKACENLSKLY